MPLSEALVAWEAEVALLVAPAVATTTMAAPPQEAVALAAQLASAERSAPAWQTARRARLTRKTECGSPFLYRAGFFRTTRTPSAELKEWFSAAPRTRGGVLIILEP